MIIKAKESIYKKTNVKEGVLLNLEIRDINTYYNRFDNTLNFLFGVFQTIEKEEILIDTLTLVLKDENKRTGYILFPDKNNTGENKITIEDYFTQEGNLEGVNIEDYGSPSVEMAKTFFTGGSFENPEIFTTNVLAEQWLLNTLNFDGRLLKENFIFN